MDYRNLLIDQEDQRTKAEIATQNNFYLGEGNLSKYSAKELEDFLAISKDARKNYELSGVPAAKEEIKRLLLNEEVIETQLKTLEEANTSNPNPASASSTSNPNPTTDKGSYPSSSSKDDDTSKRPKN